MKILRTILALVLILTVFSGPVSAQSANESIVDFAVELSIDENGFADVTETIVYNFDTNERRGIFRDIPIQYEVSEGQGYILNVTNVSVSRNGESEKVLNSSTPQFYNVRIGDENVFLTGQQTYEISYQLGPLAIDSDDNKQVIRIDAPGTGWSVGAQAVSVRMQSDAALTSSTCYEGAIGSTNQTCQAIDAGFRSSRALSSGETITAEFVFEPGTFAQSAQLTELPNNDPPAWVLPTIFGSISVILGLTVVRPLLGLIGYKRRRSQELVVAQYEPPQDMSPAEIGLLVDNSADGAELSATLINLAIKGFIRIEQTKEKSLFRKAEYTFHNIATDTGSLPRTENIIYDALFTGSEQSVTTNELKKSTSFAKQNEAFKKALGTELESMGFYKKTSLLAFDKNSRMTDEGYTKWAYIAGFRDFLSVTEKDRLAFHDAPEKKPEQFSEFLPYAVALGVEEQWIKQFEQLDVDVSEWYSGKTAGLVGVNALSSSLGSMSSSVNSSSGSSGSGGGFSGGGFSGGGGGSW